MSTNLEQILISISEQMQWTNPISLLLPTLGMGGAHKNAAPFGAASLYVKATNPALGAIRGRLFRHWTKPVPARPRLSEQWRVPFGRRPPNVPGDGSLR